MSTGGFHQPAKVERGLWKSVLLVTKLPVPITLAFVLLSDSADQPSEISSRFIAGSHEPRMFP
jgi:hypothetical protein